MVLPTEVGISFALYPAEGGSGSRKDFFMNTRKHTRTDTRALTMMALLTAVIVVLQIICSFVHFGPVSITLALTPIIIGAALYGVRAGGVLGFAFGLICLVAGLLGWDGGFIMLMMGYNDNALYAVMTVILCIGKGVLAGLAGGAVYRLLEKKNTLLAVIAAGVVTPVVNTGTFALGMLTIFNGFLSANAAAGSLNPVSMLFLSWIGVNFLFELGTNLALGTVVSRIIGVGGRLGVGKK